MLKLTGYLPDGSEINLGEPLYLNINQDENIPADDLSAVFPFCYDFPELAQIRAELDGEPLFYGTVDETRTIADSSGACIRVTARSMAALLLDNEAKPVDFYCPSASVMFGRYAKPVGILRLKGGDGVYRDQLTVSKGMSCYQALCAFSLALYGAKPRVDPSGALDLSGIHSDKKLCFSNRDGIRYNSITENKKRCALLSDVFVKLSDGEGYVYDVEEKLAKNLGVKAVRYLDASGADSALLADKMLENGVKKYYELRLVCPGNPGDILGAEAEVHDEYIGDINGLCVCGLSYTFKSGGDETILVLKRRDYVDI